MSEGSLGKDKTTVFQSRLYHLDMRVEGGRAPPQESWALPPSRLNLGKFPQFLNRFGRPPGSQARGGWRQGTCDEVAELGIEARVTVRAVQPDHPELARHVLGHGHVVCGREEGGRLVVHVQHCGQSQRTGLGLASAPGSPAPEAVSDTSRW